ncbi:hypothetical protein [Glaciihabitans sp. UYNi722]|uniref:hypothetical protein n=1 Tax=Glaciihabitans sp. UYNi722 TaxID=3156344 RepID=UPI003390B10B
MVERGTLSDAVGIDPSARPEETSDANVRPKGERLVLKRHWEDAKIVPIQNGEGGHGGGDRLLVHDVFRGADEDPLGRPADFRDGIRAVAVGIAGNESLVSGQAVSISDLGIIPT